MTIHTTFATGDTNVFRLPAAVNHAEVRVNGVPAPCSVSAGVVTMPFTPAPLAMLEFEYEDPGPVDWSFYAPLKTDLFLPRGEGPATFTRATTATVQDFQGMIRTVKAGEARFQGARRVQNLLLNSALLGGNPPTSWNRAFSEGSLTFRDTVGGEQACVISVTAGGRDMIQQSFDFVAGHSYRISAYVEEVSGNVGAVISANGGTATLSSSGSVTATAPGRVVGPVFHCTVSGTGAIRVGVNVNSSGSGDASLVISRPQVEDVTGQSNQNPSEYVSVGVTSAPLYHGAGVDGVKYFPYENGNTVGPGNVVNEARGPAIPDSKLFGYLAEGARTNLLLWSEDFDNAAWSKVDTTITTDATTAPDGSSTADLCTEGTAGTAFVARAVTATAGANYATSRWFKRGNHDWIQLIINDGLGNSARAMFNIANGTVGDTPGAGTGVVVNASVEAFPNGWYRCKLVANMASAGTNITSFSASALNGSNSSRQNNATYYMWGAQFEDNVSFASSYIPTAGSTVTRHADVLKYPFAGNADADAAQGAAYVEAFANWTAGNAGVGHAIIATANFSGPLSSGIGAPIPTQIFVRDGTNAPGAVVPSLATAIRKCASSWGANGLAITSAGQAPGTSVFDGDMGSTAIAIGCSTGGTAQWFGTIRNVKVAKRQLREIQLRQLTS